MSEPDHRFGPFAPLRSPGRARLRRAMIELVLEQGLNGVDADMLCARAEFDRGEFARDFDGVRDCAMQVYVANIGEFDRVLNAAVDATDPWRLRLRASACAAARHVRDRPLSTRFDMLAMLEAGELAQAHRDRHVRWLIALIDEGRQELPDPSAVGPATAEGIFGAIYRLLARELVGEGRIGRAEEIVPQLMYLAVRPYLGHEVALEELEQAPPAQSGAGGSAEL